MTDLDLSKWHELQRARLRLLLVAASNEGSKPATCNYGAMLLLDQPGDVAFLAPIFPEIRGCEIVSADRDGSYDVWKGGRMIECSLNREQMIAWLQKYARPDAEVMANAKRWTEDTLQYYGIRKRPFSRR